MRPSPRFRPIRMSSPASQPIVDHMVREVARLRFGAGNTSVPIFDAPGIDPQTVLDAPAPISAHRRALWQREGYQLEQHRRVVSVPLADGRRAAVPVDQIQVRYVGREPL